MHQYLQGGHCDDHIGLLSMIINNTDTVRLVQAIGVALLLCDELVSSGVVKFLMTGRLNQDCLENLSSQV